MLCDGKVDFGCVKYHMCFVVEYTTLCKLSVVCKEIWYVLENKEYVCTYDRGEPAISYRWTVEFEKITGWGSRLQENYRSF